MYKWFDTFLKVVENFKTILGKNPSMLPASLMPLWKRESLLSYFPLSLKCAAQQSDSSVLLVISRLRPLADNADS